MQHNGSHISRDLIMNNILQFFLSAFIFLISATLVSVSHVEMSHAAGKEELVFLTCSEYIDPDIVKEFEIKYNVNLKEVYYETDEIREEMMVATRGKGNLWCDFW